MGSGSDFKAEMEAEDRLEWLRTEYARLQASAAPLMVQRAEHKKAMEALEETAEAIARQAFGILLALGKPEAEAMKEIRSWQKPAG